MSPPKKVSAVQLRKLVSDVGAWAVAAEVIRSKISEKGWRQAEIAKRLVVSQATVSRFLTGNPTQATFLQKTAGLIETLWDLRISIDDLMRPAPPQDRLLCIDRHSPNDEYGVAECASVYFKSAGDHALPVPTDPRSAKDELSCRYCGVTLSSVCPGPSCGKPIVGGCYCPYCHHRYIAGVPEELRGLTGPHLVLACEKRNAENQIAREYPENNSLSSPRLRGSR